MNAWGRRAVFVVLAALSASCGGSQGSPEDTAQRDIAAAGQQLQGSWVLADFRPDVALEPMLAQLLAFQVGHLAVQLDGTHLYATGVGVQATRTYRIDEAVQNHVKLTLLDEAGVPYQVEGDLGADVFRFHALTSPWTGYGTLRRAAPMGR